MEPRYPNGHLVIILILNWLEILGISDWISAYLSLQARESTLRIKLTSAQI